MDLLLSGGGCDVGGGCGIIVNELNVSLALGSFAFR
jgi:hypothetical protein